MVALSYGERGESGELWKQEGQTIENVKQIRHAEAEAAAAQLGASFRALDLGDYPLADRRRRAQPDRRRDPRVRARRARHAHRHRPVQPRPPGRLPRRRPRPLARRRRRRAERVHDDPPAGSCSCSSPTSPSCATSCRRRSSTSRRSIEQKQAAMAQMKAQAYLQTYYAERAAHRGNHARRARGDAGGRVTPRPSSASSRRW